jgi:hypothetical protein
MLYTPHNLINMNHGLINMLHKGVDSKQENPRIIELYDVVQEIKEYFFRYGGRDKHYVAMKVHAVRMLYKMNLTQQMIAELLNLKNHSSINHLLYKYKKFDGYDDFIERNFNNYVKTFMYPLSEKKTGPTANTKDYKLTRIEKPSNNIIIPQTIKQYPSL